MHGDGRRLFYLYNRIQALEEKLSQVTLKTEEPKASTRLPGVRSSQAQATTDSSYPTLRRLSSLRDYRALGGYTFALV